jgi:TonB-linked SusC/RagA family outer membrane protein
MKLTMLILIAAILQVSATVKAQKITLSEKNASLDKIFNEISDQCGYDFLASSSVLKQAKPVSIDVKNEELKTVLDLIFQSQPLQYVIQEKMVVVSKKEPKSADQIKTDIILLVTISGKITDTTGKPLFGATIKIEGQSTGVQSHSDGTFEIDAQSGDQIIVSFVGYRSYTFTAKNSLPFQNIELHAIDNKLREVVVSTGYQTLPKERATGSFVQIDSTLLNRKVSTNILDRLDGVTSGIIFNKSLGSGNNATISIRGRSTIFANPDPLIVVDNFPYDGDIGNINPNDIESISILKDAAAASIWGVKAGNGVIVITTKKGRKSDKVHISFNANTTVSNRPDIFYQPQISSADYVDLEQFLFNKGYYDNTISNGYSTISPALAIMLQKRNGQISAADSASQVNHVKTLDVRNDLERYIYRPAVNQQYSLSLDGGSDTHTYYISAGYDKNLQDIQGSSYDRFTLNANNKYSLLKNKLQLSVGVLLTTSNTKTNSNAYTDPLYPYEQLADANGNHLSVVQLTGLRKQYTDTAAAGKLLDWNYRPLDENGSNNVTQLTDYKLNTNLTYNILTGLNIAINYQYEKGISDNDRLQGSNTYYTRNLINSFSQIDPTTGDVTSQVPQGGIDNTVNSTYSSDYGRAQINYSRKFGGLHDLNLLGGIEVKSYQSSSISNTLYGFDPSTDSSVPVDYIDYFPQYYGFGYNTIPYYNAKSYTNDRERSAFFNGSYTYNGKYTLSASARRDESNIFGVKSNQKGVPLWSSGFMWAINKEPFYHFDQLPILKLRVTYGYNGNVDKTTSAYLTGVNIGPNFWNTQYTIITNPPNPALSWEKDRNINLGIDYATKNNLFSGSLEYYIKDGLNLIANSPIAPQTGVSQFTGNSADTRTNGVDFVLNKNSIGNSAIKWQSTFLFSYSKDIITRYKVKQENNAQIIAQNYINPLQGYPYNAIFSYAFKGLDNTGKPQGLLNGVISEDYTSIESSTNPADLIYNGSATPLIYGSFRNTLSYSDFDLSFNITYKLDYYFRRPNVFSGSNYGSYSYQAADFDKRWQKPGDELTTNIPALIYPEDPTQDGFYSGSSILVERADNIRLQDIRLSYNVKSKQSNPVFKNIQVYFYLNNVGILWKATKQNIDPDYLNTAFVDPKTFSLGLSANF